MPEYSYHSLQTKALSSLRADFALAASDARQALRDRFEDYLQSPAKPIGDTFSQKARSREMEYKLGQLNFLTKGSQGDYEHRDADFSSSLSGYGTLWHDYLHSINKLSHGFGAIPNNRYTIEKLVRQNGPAKMQQRLENFAKRRIDQAVKAVKKPNGCF